MNTSYQQSHIIRKLAPFKIDGLAIPYAEFAPKLFNLCMTLGFRKGLIMPSRAFCSDENQGWPIILLTKHFGTFPFNHGRVGGIVATDRHGPHAHHGEDSVIVQASHVGYDPGTGAYGTYIRPKMAGTCVSVSCGKITHVITPYLEQYQFAKERIFLSLDDKGQHLITVKNSFVDFDIHPVKNGLVLNLESIVKTDPLGKIIPIAAISTSQTYEVSEDFRKKIDATGYVWKKGEGESIGELLTSELFYFREEFHEKDEAILLERNLIEFMPTIVTSRNPPLRAAKINIQLEFARTVESIRRGAEYAGKNLLYIAGLNVDISEHDDYPATTYFVPWAAHIQLKDGTPAEYAHPLEQDRLFELIMAQDSKNPEQADLKEQIAKMLKAPRFDIHSPK
ncbi:MAG: hypothetical protein PF442_11515 [Desulfobulbaceae bacterium]|jgi:hypothetical protein|nr:hypothetical protein [Desulfobulbaceae bacterium]